MAFPLYKLPSNWWSGSAGTRTCPARTYASSNACRQRRLATSTRTSSAIRCCPIAASSVRQLHWTDWPDREVPPCKLTSLELLSAVRGSKVPIVVHCLAGIGRTGTIVAIEYILERIAEGNQLEVMPELGKQLRDQRAFSIQNDL
ncbi:unnamed protein product [Caenorhabditis sp. 36 PRJEB53466]|nr:unnamed protein product [Caenorhabditis sp. 36 PRJEB53466]